MAQTQCIHALPCEALQLTPKQLACKQETPCTTGLIHEVSEYKYAKTDYLYQTYNIRSAICRTTSVERKVDEEVAHRLPREGRREDDT